MSMHLHSNECTTNNNNLEFSAFHTLHLRLTYYQNVINKCDLYFALKNKLYC